MKTTKSFTKKLFGVSYSVVIRSVLSGMLLFLTSIHTTFAQVQEYTRPSWWFGRVAAANFNFYRGSTYKLNDDITSSVTFHDGFGVGLFIGPMIEYRRP